MFQWSLIISPLLADRSHWERLGDAFKEKSANPIGSEELLVGAGIVGLLALLVLLLQAIARRQAVPHTYCNPHKMFQQLCAAHRLRNRDRQLLKRLAKTAHLHQPAELFLKPELFLHAAIPAELASQAEEIGNLKRRLFGAEAELSSA